MAQPFLFVALDDLAKDEKGTLASAEEFVLIVKEETFGFKGNLDYFLNPRINLNNAVFNLQQLGRPVFVDLKMLNGSRTMRSVLETLVKMGVDFTNIYALADDLLPEALRITEGSKTKVLGLTVLTHFTEGYCQRWFRRSLRETVRFSAEVALERGCHGIILPGNTLDVVQDLKTLKVVPGVRPKGYKDTRHEQEVTPREAAEKGADIAVCGGPIMRQKDLSAKVAALKMVLSELKG